MNLIKILKKGLNIVQADIFVIDRDISLDDIINAVCEVTGESTEAMKGLSQKRELVTCRHLYYYFAKPMNKWTLEVIGAVTSNKDHSTVSYGAKSMADLSRSSKMISRYIKRIDEILK